MRLKKAEKQIQKAKRALPLNLANHFVDDVQIAECIKQHGGVV